tara:strand:- start:21668 stop:22249 length:582 start_codon:yes stop_codon:yes gene_type:complete
MKVNVFLIKNSKNEVIFQTAVEDLDAIVKPYFSEKHLTKEEIELIQGDKTILSLCSFLNGSGSFDFYEISVHKIVGYTQLPSLSFELIQKELSWKDFLDNNINYDKALAALIVTRKDTDEIIFAEGTELDGYEYHQMKLPLSEFSIADIENLLKHDRFIEIDGEYVNFLERECKDFYNDNLDYIYIRKEYFYL